MNLKDFEVIDGRGLSSDDLFDVLRENGVGVKAVPKRERVAKKEKEKEEKTLRPQKPLCEYTKEDTIVAKWCDIQEIYSDLDLIYDFNKDTVFMPGGSFTSRHGAAVSVLSPIIITELHSLNKEQMEYRQAAFDYIMYNIMPKPMCVKIKETSVAELKSEWLKLHGSYMSEAAKARVGATVKEYSTEMFTYVDGNHYFMDEMLRARTIKEAYDYVMTAGDEEDMKEAQEMMDKYISIFSDDLEKILAYRPHEKREIPMDRRCEASKQRKLFKQNDVVQLVVPNKWITRRQSYKGEFDVIKFPNGFFIGSDNNRIDLSGYSFNYTITPVATDGANGGVNILNDGLLKGYDFYYGSLLTLSKSVRNSIGTGWEKDFINGVSIKDLIVGITEYAASKSAEFDVLGEESLNTNVESCTTVKEMCR